MTALNINLIIPFKDNRGGRLKLFRIEIERFKTQLENRVDELKRDLDVVHGADFDLTIAARSDGNSKKYYWRFKSGKRDRKFNRLHAESIVEFLKQTNHRLTLHLKEIEEELILINANLKALKGMLDAIEQSIDERVALLSAAF
jgi:hypothetical protein